MELREYQKDIIEQARTLMKKGVRSICIQSSTGSGKTLLTAHMLKTASEKGIGSWFLVHRRELIHQSMKAFSKVGVPFGVVAAGFEADPSKLVQIASVQTLANRYLKLKKPGLIVYDEAHHCPAASWAKIYRGFPEAFQLLLTATPIRNGGEGLGEFAQEMVCGPSTAWLIENGFLAKYRLFAPASVDVSSVHKRMGDFVTSELNAVLDKPTITGDAIAHYRKLANGKRALVFAVSIEHSKHIVSQFQAAGIPAAHVDGETDANERDAAIRKFTTGEILILSNCSLFGEGFDLECLEAVILLRPTLSLSLYLQQIGRVLRPFPGKATALILDHVGNCERHGLPDQEREWSLDSRDGNCKRGREGNNTSVRICPKCFAAQFPGRPTCNLCGHIFEQKPRVVEQTEGELVEVDRATVQIKRKQEQGRAKTLADLEALGRSRGYKRPELWARFIYKSRLKKMSAR